MPEFNPLKDGFELPSKFVKDSINQFSEDYKWKKIITYIHADQKGKYLEFAGFKKDKETDEVIKKGKYKTVEADGIDVISGMDFSCDQGFNIAEPPKKKISPENTNPSAIIALDSQTGKKVN